LNLSILMLLSSSFNAFGAEDVSKAAEIVQAATNLAVTGILDAVVDNGAASKEISEAVVASIVQLPTSPELLSNLNPEVQSTFAKFVGRFVDFVPETVKQKVCAHPWISTIVGSCALVGTGALAYRAFRNRGNDASSAAVAGGSQANLGGSFASLSPSLASFSNSFRSAIGLSDESQDEALTKALYDTIDSQIAARDGNVNAGEGNEGRTLLMTYAMDGNLPAVKYLVEQKGANVNAEDIYYGQGNPGRTAIALASAFGHADVVEYLAAKSSPGTSTSITREWANSGYYQDAKDATQRYARIMAAFDSMDGNTAAALADE